MEGWKGRKVASKKQSEIAKDLTRVVRKEGDDEKVGKGDGRDMEAGTMKGWE